MEYQSFELWLMDLEVPVTSYGRENFDTYLAMDVSLIAAGL